MINYYLVFFSFFILSCKVSPKEDTKNDVLYNVIKTDLEWQSELSEISYFVLRESGTEYAFTGKYDDHYENGIYKCMGCGIDLYNSKYKYNSKSGWPSFDRGINDNLEFSIEYRLGFPRTEIKCANCGGHLGHLFNDGPKKTTGQRHCINSAALNFESINE